MPHKRWGKRSVLFRIADCEQWLTSRPERLTPEEAAQKVPQLLEAMDEQRQAIRRLEGEIEALRSDRAQLRELCTALLDVLNRGAEQTACRAP